MRYKAFMSYSHAADGKLAYALQTSLQRFGKPWYRLRAIRVFRDKTGLSATPALWPAIEKALCESEYFILLASPEAAASQWVGQEVEYWCRHASVDKLLIVLTNGEIAWDRSAEDFDWKRTTALSTNLRGIFKQEPMYVDLRWTQSDVHLSLNDPKLRDAVADVGATLHGRPKDELIGEDIRQHSRTVRLASIGVALVITLAFLAMWQAYLATQRQKEAKHQSERVLEQAETTKRIWVILDSMLGEMSSAEQWDCNNGIGKNSFARIIVSPTWEHLSGTPQWSTAQKKVLAFVAATYNSCYHNLQSGPSLVVEGHFSGLRMVDAEAGICPDCTPFDLLRGSTRDYSLNVSVKYAKLVAQELVSMGIPSEKLQIVGSGEEKPLILPASSTTVDVRDEEQRKELVNNRVEVRIRSYRAGE